MSDRTKQTLIIVAGIVIAILVVLFAVAVYQGSASVPTELQTAIWGLIIAAIGGVSVYINTRSNAATRLNSDRNAQVTQNKIEQVSTDLHDGLKQEFGKVASDMVAKNNEVVAAKLAEVVAPDPLLASIEANTRETAAAVSEVAANTSPEVNHD